MSITSAICNSFRVELGRKLHDFTASTGDVFKCALYTESATLNKDTTVYSATNEVSGTNYTAGGAVLTNITPVVSVNVGVYDFADLVFTNLTVSGIRGALIYNSTNGNRAVAVLNFATNSAPVAKDLTIVFPTPTPTTAILRMR